MSRPPPRALTAARRSRTVDGVVPRRPRLAATSAADSIRSASSSTTSTAPHNLVQHLAAGNVLGAVKADPGVARPQGAAATSTYVNRAVVTQSADPQLPQTSGLLCDQEWNQRRGVEVQDQRRWSLMRSLTEPAASIGFERAARGPEGVTRPSAMGRSRASGPRWHYARSGRPWSVTVIVCPSRTDRGNGSRPSRITDPDVHPSLRGHFEVLVWPFRRTGCGPAARRSCLSRTMTAFSGTWRGDWARHEGSTAGYIRRQMLPVNVDRSATGRRGALEDDSPAVVTSSRAEVDDPVGVGHHGLVVLDHDDRLTGSTILSKVPAGARRRPGAGRSSAHEDEHPPVSPRCVASFGRCARRRTTS